MIRINLAPPDEHAGAGRRWPRILGGALVAILAGMGWWYAELKRGEARLTAEIAALSHEVATWQSIRARVEAERAALADLARRGQTIEALARERHAALRALDAVADAVPHDLWLTALERRGPEVRASGSARVAHAVADFAASLRATGEFRDVEIALSRREAGKAAPLSFEVTCRVAPEPPSR